jgi:hypothetical protein
LAKVSNTHSRPAKLTWDETTPWAKMMVPILAQSYSSLLEQLLSPQNTGTAMFVMLFGVTLIISLAAIISQTIIKIRRDANMTALKQDMLDRGLSADEIKTVLEAGKNIKK